MAIASKTFDHYTELAAKITEKKIEELSGSMNDMNGRHNEFSRVLAQATTRFAITGIGHIPDNRHYNTWWLREGNRSYFRWHKFFAGLAQDLKRPYVFVNDINDYLVVQRRRYTEPLIAEFLLGGVKTEDKWQMWSSTDKTIRYRNTSDKWYFSFYGDLGRELLGNWIESCATDPIKRKALRLA